MQEQGVRPDDPEFIKAHNLLTAIQRQQAYQKQQRMAQQQRQQQQMNGAAPEAAPNGTHGKFCRDPLSDHFKRPSVYLT